LNDWFDNLPGNVTSGDAVDPNTTQIIKNAIMSAAASGHGFVGEEMGAVQGMGANPYGWTPLGFVAGTAGTIGDITGSPDFAPCPQVVSQVNSHPPVTTGVPTSFTQTDTSCFDPVNTTVGLASSVIYKFADVGPALVFGSSKVVAAPEASTALLFVFGLIGFATSALRQRKSQA
jgi:hypothetical protein